MGCGHTGSFSPKHVLPLLCWKCNSFQMKFQYCFVSQVSNIFTCLQLHMNSKHGKISRKHEKKLKVNSGQWNSPILLPNSPNKPQQLLFFKTTIWIPGSECQRHSFQLEAGQLIRSLPFQRFAARSIPSELGAVGCLALQLSVCGMERRQRLGQKGVFIRHMCAFFFNKNCSVLIKKLFSSCVKGKERLWLR